MLRLIAAAHAATTSKIEEVIHLLVVVTRLRLLTHLIKIKCFWLIRCIEIKHVFLLWSLRLIIIHLLWSVVGPLLLLLLTILQRRILVQWYMLLLLRLPVLLIFNLLLQFRHIVICQIANLFLRSSGHLFLSTLILYPDLISNGCQLNLRNVLPVLEEFQHLVDRWSVFWVWNQNDVYQVFHFLTDTPIDFGIIYWHEVLGIENADFASILVWMVIKAEGEDDAAEHPDVDLRVDAELHVLVDHLGRPVHHGRVLLVELELVFHVLRARTLAVLEHGLAGGPEIAEAEGLLLLVEQNVLDLDVSVLDALPVHVLQPAADVNQDV